jgi:hypothetical protein
LLEERLEERKKMNMKGILFAGSLDIVGDVHGEIDALNDLLGEQ